MRILIALCVQVLFLKTELFLSEKLHAPKFSPLARTIIVIARITRIRGEHMPLQSIGTHIKVKDFSASKVFYETLGFKQVFAYGPDQEVKEDYRGMVFQVGDTKLEIADGHRAVKHGVFARPMADSKISLMIGVDSLQPIIEICKREGIIIAVKPRHYYWGTLELVVKDPDGVVLVFIAPYSKEEAEKIGADERFSIART